MPTSLGSRLARCCCRGAAGSSLRDAHPQASAMEPFGMNQENLPCLPGYSFADPRVGHAPVRSFRAHCFIRPLQFPWLSFPPAGRFLPNVRRALVAGRPRPRPTRRRGRVASRRTSLEHRTSRTSSRTTSPAPSRGTASGRPRSSRLSSCVVFRPGQAVLVVSRPSTKSVHPIFEGVPSARARRVTRRAAAMARRVACASPPARRPSRTMDGPPPSHHRCPSAASLTPRSSVTHSRHVPFRSPRRRSSRRSRRSPSRRRSGTCTASPACRAPPRRLIPSDPPPRAWRPTWRFRIRSGRSPRATSGRGRSPRAVRAPTTR